jgi:hypothetical protein
MVVPACLMLESGKNHRVRALAIQSWNTDGKEVYRAFFAN